MSTRLGITLLVLAVAAFASWYIARDDGDSGLALQDTEASGRGYYLTKARILGTGADGALLYEIRAERAEQQADERILFSDVEVEYTPASEVPWAIRANNATLSPTQPQIILEGNVRAMSEQGFSGDKTEIQTESLRLDPEKYTAETDERIYFRVGERTLTGTGMLASLDENRMEIRSNVSGRFVP